MEEKNTQKNEKREKHAHTNSLCLSLAPRLGVFRRKKKLSLSLCFFFLFFYLFFSESEGKKTKKTKNEKKKKNAPSTLFLALVVLATRLWRVQKLSLFLFFLLLNIMDGKVAQVCTCASCNKNLLRRRTRSGCEMKCKTGKEKTSIDVFFFLHGFFFQWRLFLHFLFSALHCYPSRRVCSLVDVFSVNLVSEACLRCKLIVRNGVVFDTEKNKRSILFFSSDPDTTTIFSLSKKKKKLQAQKARKAASLLLLASARGYLDDVKALLSSDDAPLPTDGAVADKRRATPAHYAAAGNHSGAS